MYDLGRILVAAYSERDNLHMDYGAGMDWAVWNCTGVSLFCSLSDIE